MKKIIIAFVFLFSGTVHSAWFGLVEDKTPEQIAAEKIEMKKKVDICFKDISLEWDKYKSIVKNYYFFQNRTDENGIIKQYKKINVEMLPKRLFESESLTEYMHRVMSEIILNEKLFSENKMTRDVFVKKINSLIFSWTVPYEILATENIYNHSLMDEKKELYKNINRTTYLDYRKFIFKIIPKVDGTLNSKIDGEAVLGTFFPESALQEVCKSYLDGIISDDEPESVVELFLSYALIAFNEHFFENVSSDFLLNENFTKYKEKGHVSIIFNDSNDELNKSDDQTGEEKSIILNNPFNDEWYLMIREYIVLQEKFYEIKAEINKIILALAKLPSSNIEKVVSDMERKLIVSDSLYRKLDAIVRYNIIGLPLAIYSDVFSHEIVANSSVLGMGGDEDKVREIALKYNQSCANMQKYVASDFTKNKFLNTVKIIKKQLDEKEYEELKMSAKLSQDWLNMLNKVKVTNK